MQLWTFLHITSMFGAVMVTAGSAVFVTWAIRQRDLDGLHSYFRMAPRVDSIGGLLFLAGIVFGVISAVAFGWDLLRGWLIVAYLLVAAIAITGMAISPYLRRLKDALDASDEAATDGPSEELEAALDRPDALIVTIVLLILIVLVIADMVFKPFP